MCIHARHIPCRHHALCTSVAPTVTHTGEIGTTGGAPSPNALSPYAFKTLGGTHSSTIYPKGGHSWGSAPHRDVGLSVGFASRQGRRTGGTGALTCPRTRTDSILIGDLHPILPPPRQGAYPSAVSSQHWKGTHPSAYTADVARGALVCVFLPSQGEGADLHPRIHHSRKRIGLPSLFLLFSGI